jgi:hypothetical protein
MKKILAYTLLAVIAVIGLADTGVGIAQSNTLYQDRFSDDDRGWKEDPVWSYSDDNQYRMFLRHASSISHSDVPESSLYGLDQYCVQVGIKLLIGSALAEDGFVGFFIGGQSSSSRAFPSATWFGIDSFGSVQVLGVDATGRTVFLDGIRRFTNVFENATELHTLQLDVHGSTVVISLDGHELDTVGSINTVGEMGFMAFSFNDSNLNARFDNLIVYDTCPE